MNPDVCLKLFIVIVQTPGFVLLKSTSSTLIQRLSSFSEFGKNEKVKNIDGTLMNISHRKKFVEQRPKDWDKFREATKDDVPNLDVFAIAIALQKQGHNILIASGRNKSQRAITMMQLMKEKLVFRALELRSDTDYRPDHIVKADMLEKFKADGWKPE